MIITINGIKVEMDEMSLDNIINQYKINPNNCIVEINGQFIEKDHYSTTSIREGDRLELIRFIGGG